jgi:hypothetical protein
MLDTGNPIVRNVYLHCTLPEVQVRRVRAQKFRLLQRFGEFARPDAIEDAMYDTRLYAAVSDSGAYKKRFELTSSRRGCSLLKREARTGIWQGENHKLHLNERF